jgi:hypothetical protein
MRLREGKGLRIRSVQWIGFSVANSYFGSLGQEDIKKGSDTNPAKGCLSDSAGCENLSFNRFLSFGTCSIALFALGFASTLA